MKQYYNINKIFLSQISDWSTQSTFMKILLPAIIASFIFNIGFFEIGGWPTQNTFMKILLPTIIASFIFSIGFLECETRIIATGRLGRHCLALVPMKIVHCDRRRFEKIVSSCIESYFFCLYFVHANNLRHFFIQYIKLSETWRTIMEDCECLIIVLMTIGGYIKLFGIVLNNKRVEQLLSLIDYHWLHIFTHFRERNVMHDYAIVGRKMTISYAVIVYTLMSLYMLIPIIPKLLDYIVPLNESRQNEYLFDINYSFDRDKYYYSVLLHSYFTTVMTISVMVIVDTIYMVFAQHACGLFAAIGQRLENLKIDLNKSNWLTEHAGMICEKYDLADCALLKKDDEIYSELILVLRKHQMSIEYVSILDSSFALYSFLLLFINMITTSLLGIQILTLMEHKEKMIRYVSMFIGSFMHLFVLSYPGQRIMDHSADIFYKAYNMQWYKMSRRSTRLLSILLYRCYVPCTLTAGKMYVLSMANYASIVQASVSYFTTFSSLR